jgi:hypothetical protein
VSDDSRWAELIARTEKDPRVAKARLARVLVRLKRRAESLPMDRAEALEERYFRLKEQLKHASPADLPSFHQQASLLEHEIAQ